MIRITCSTCSTDTFLIIFSKNEFNFATLGVSIENLLLE